MRRTRFLAAIAALTCLSFGASAHEPCGCRDREVLNGRLNTADFDGGVGDRYGDGGAGGGYVVYGSGAAGAFAGSNAFAAARASATARASVSTRFGGGAHGGHGGGHR